MTESWPADLTENDLAALQEQKRDLIQAMHDNEEEKLALMTEIHALEHELQQIKSRYRKEQQLKQQNKRKLEDIHKSHSWRFSRPVRKIGGLLKRGKDPNVEAIKE